VLDAFTNGGLGVALLSPLDATRYFAPLRPIEVSPLNIASFLSARGAAVLANELWSVWLPFTLLGGVLWLARRIRG
jgi:inner membrane protein